MSEFDLEPVLLKAEYNYVAPDGSEIRLLAQCLRQGFASLRASSSGNWSHGQIRRKSHFVT